MTPTSNQLGAMREIPLTRGLVALVDAADYEQLMNYTWYASDKGYAMASATVDGKRVNLRMHRVILGLPKGDDRKADHINGNRTDNRRANLRICAVSENNCNVGVRSNSKSGFKGVSWNKQRGRWHSRIGANGKVLHLGYFDTPEDAHEAFVKAARELHGDFFCERNLNRVVGQTGAQQ